MNLILILVTIDVADTVMSNNIVITIIPIIKKKETMRRRGSGDIRGVMAMMIMNDNTVEVANTAMSNKIVITIIPATRKKMTLMRSWKTIT